MSNRIKTALIGLPLLATLSLMSAPAQAGVDGNPFEGLYLGLYGNYARVSSTNSYVDLEPASDANNFFTGIGEKSEKSSGYGGSLYGGIGTNFWGPLHASIEGALGLSGGSGNAVLNTVTPAQGVEGDADFVPASFGTDNVRIKAGFAFDVNARLGFTVSDRVMIYGLGGYTSTKFKVSDSTGEFSKTAGGYRYGAGFEVGIMEDVALRIEYTRTEHSDFTWERTSADNLIFDPSTESVRIGLILHMD